MLDSRLQQQVTTRHQSLSHYSSRPIAMHVLNAFFIAYWQYWTIRYVQLPSKWCRILLVMWCVGLLYALSVSPNWHVRFWIWCDLALLKSCLQILIFFIVRPRIRQASSSKSHTSLLIDVSPMNLLPQWYASFIPFNVAILLCLYRQLETYSIRPFQTVVKWVQLCKQVAGEW